MVWILAAAALLRAVVSGTFELVLIVDVRVMLVDAEFGCVLVVDAVGRAPIGVELGASGPPSEMSTSVDRHWWQMAYISTDLWAFDVHVH